MHEEKYEHIKQDQMTWLKSLENLRQENVYLKNRLAEIIKNEVSSELLEKAEYFLGLFLDKDAVISLLRRDIAHWYAANTASAHNGELKDILQEQTKLKNDVERLEKEFVTVKSAFNKFLQDASMS